MANEDISPNVVLTADNSQYDRTMQQSATVTDSLGTSIDTIAGKLDKLSKSAGKKLIGIAAADVALITGATAAFAAYEKQMSSLQAQAAVLNRTQESSNRAMDSYTRSVSNLRQAFGTTTSEAAALTQQLSKVTDRTQSIQNLSTTFVKMGQATGESTVQLATSVTNLQRVMGTPQRDTKAYADQLTTLAAGANTSASALADFTSQLAPLGRQVGISQTDMTGFAEAFTKAGQDGFQASTVFSKMVSDISYATQTGSPELSKYSNLIGVTMEQFKDMSGTEQVVKIFDQLNRLGPRAITELNQLGFDGMRTMRAITAMSNQSGGIGTSIQKARAAFGDGSVDRGSKAAMKGMTDEFAKMRSELAMTAESIGSAFAPAMTKIFSVVEKVAGSFRSLMEGPFGDFLKGVLAVVAPVAAVAGTLLTMASALTKVAAAALVLRGSGMLGFQNARAGGGFMGVGGTGVMATQRAGMLAGNASWFQRAMFNSGALAGGLVGTRTPGQAGVMARGAGLGMRGAGALANFASQALYTPLTYRGVNNPGDRWRMFTSPTAMGSVRTGMNAIGNIPVYQSSRLTAAQSAWARMNPMAAAAGSSMAGGAAAAANATTAASAARTSAALAGVATAAGPLTRGFNGLTSGIGRAMGTLASAGAGAGRWAAQGAGSAMGAAGAGIAGMGIRGIGSTLLAGATSPLGIMALGLGGYMAYDKLRDKTTAEYTDLSGSGNSYRQAGGLSANQVWTPGIDDPDPKVTLADAMRIDDSDSLQADRDSHKLTNKGLYGLSKEESAAYLSTQWDTYKNNAQSRQAVVLDLIDKFDTGTAQDIIGRLDAGEKFGIQAWDLGDLEGVSKEEGGDRISGAMGMLQDQASAVYGDEGAEGSQRVRAQGISKILQELSSTSGNTRTKAFGLLSDKYLSGAEFDARDIDKMTKDEFIVSAGRGGAVAGLKANPEIAALMKSDLDDPKNQADLMSRQLSRLAGVGAEQAEGVRGLLSDLGVDNSEDIDPTKQAEVNEALLKVLKAEGVSQEDNPDSTLNRLRGMGSTGKMLANSGALSDAYANQGDLQKQYEAIDTVYSSMIGSGEDMLKVYTDLGNAQAEVGNTGDHMYKMLEAIRGRTVGDIRTSQGLMTRPEVYQSEADILGAALADDSPLNPDQKTAATDQFIQTTMEQAQYFKQMLLQQKQFELSMARAQEDFDTSRGRMEEQYNLSRSRAQEDFHLQRQYQEQDYQLSRRRAESDFELSQKRATESMTRSMKRSRADFNMSRQRQEEDYNHSVEMMIKQQARSMYSAYERITVARTSSSTFLTLNMKDQVESMQKQAGDLDTARGMGLSDDAINQLQLGKTENAQQLSRLVEDLKNNPAQVAELNTLVQQSLAAAGELVTDESSEEWSEWERQYNLARDRAMEDFRKAVRRGRKDFKIQMGQMEDDFAKSMSRQAEDYEKAQQRQQKAFSKSMARGAEDYQTAVDNMTSDFGKSMTRAQEDLDLLNQNVAGNLKDILVAATEQLGTETAKQAQLVLDTFENLDETLGESGVSIMQRMALIFGFDYTPPKNKGGNKGPGGNQVASDDGTGPQISNASGGVLNAPRSIGSDNMHFYSKDHGTLSLAGGEGIMVPEWVDQMGGPAAIRAMNDAARGKRMGFWQGGVMPLPGATSIEQHLSGYPNAQWSGDLNWPGRSDYGKPIVAYQSGIARPFDYGADTSYGRGVVVEGGSSNSLYAHMSAIVKKIAGEKVAAGQVIGYVGDYGNTGNPATSHLHFEVSSGGWSLPWVGNEGLTGKIGGQVDQNGNVIGLKDVLKEFYPNIEEAAGMVKLGGGIPEGHMSKTFNKMARKAWKKFDKGLVPSMTGDKMTWAAAGGIVDTPQIVGLGEAGPEMVLPLDGRGAQFINDIMLRSQIGTEAKATHLTGSQPMANVVHQTNHIDRSTQFTGPITVQANNPAEFLSQMKVRQRTAALSQPVLRGSQV